MSISFEPEKVFDWSNNRIYDDYIEFNGLKIIVEQQGTQHYTRGIIKGNRSRSVEEEKQNIPEELYQFYQYFAQNNQNQTTPNINDMENFFKQYFGY